MEMRGMRLGNTQNDVQRRPRRKNPLPGLRQQSMAPGWGRPPGLLRGWMRQRRQNLRNVPQTRA